MKKRYTDTTAATAARYRPVTLTGYFGTEHDFPSIKAAAAWLRCTPLAVFNAIKRSGRIGGFEVRYTEDTKKPKTQEK